VRGDSACVATWAASALAATWLAGSASIVGTGACAGVSMNSMAKNAIPPSVRVSRTDTVSQMARLSP